MNKHIADLFAASCVLFCILPLNAIAGTQTGKDLLKSAQAALSKGDNTKALALVNAALAKSPENVTAWLTRAAVNESLEKYTEAVTDYSRVLVLDPKQVDVLQSRGVVLFKSGRVKESVLDFDRYIELRPKFKPKHWQRGISHYYAKMYKEGKAQFEGYQTFDSNDVENAVWRYLCMVPLVGKKKARKDMLKIGDDRRVPMRQIYDMFIGKLKPKDILAAAKAGKPAPAQLNRRLFYAHLYLGLYYETEGKKKLAFQHLNTATEKHRIGHYMWDVARVHRNILRKKK